MVVELILLSMCVLQQAYIGLPIIRCLLYSSKPPILVVMGEYLHFTLSQLIDARYGKISEVRKDFLILFPLH